MPDHKNLTEALAAFQADLPDVQKGSTNPAFKSNEQWLPVTGHPNYEVSSLGRVRTLPHVVMRSNGIAQTIHGRIQKGRPSNGYRLAGLGNGVSQYIHTLVLEAFVGPRPDGADACHGNGVRDDNRVENLRWDTRTENAQDTIRHGHNYRLRSTHCPRGHELTAPNLVASIAKNGHRSCLACSRAVAYNQHHGRGKDWSIADRYYAQIMEEVA